MDNLIKSIYAGFMIGIGGTIYLSLDNKIIGAFLFSFGLLTIITQNFNLYTGKVGYENSFKELGIMIFGNAIGTYIIAFLVQIAKPDLIQSASLIWSNKLNLHVSQVASLSLLCGIMMYLAVDNYKKTGHILFVILPVVIFILSGYEHSIANLFYLFLYGEISKQMIVFMIICILGNAVGARSFHIIKEINNGSFNN